MEDLTGCKVTAVYVQKHGQKARWVAVSKRGSIVRTHVLPTDIYLGTKAEALASAAERFPKLDLSGVSA